MNMTDEEALEMMESCVRDWPNGKFFGSLNNALQALREKVAAKKPKRPTLEELENLVRWAGTTDSVKLWNGYAFSARPIETMTAAADLIKEVRERLVGDLKMIYAREVRYQWDRWAKEILDLLGVPV